MTERLEKILDMLLVETEFKLAQRELVEAEIQAYLAQVESEKRKWQ